MMLSPKTLSKSHLEELVAKLKAQKQAAQKEPEKPTEPEELSEEELSEEESFEVFEATEHTWNTEQQQAISMALSRKSFCLIGAAGTGKTTVTREIVRQLIASNTVAPLNRGTKKLIAGSPGIIGVSFIRRAVRNLRNAMPAEMRKNILTAHALLEYSPVFYEIDDPITGEPKKTMRFEPMRHRHYQLPSSISTILIDESSMFSTELYNQIIEALPYPEQVQFIILGDLNQLPTVYGKAILGYKLNELPVVELVQVYRQALKSPIKRFAHRILKGTAITNEELLSDEWKEPPKLILHPWKKQTDVDLALAGAAAFLRKEIDERRFNEEDTVVLCPFNVNLGTIELNKIIAQKLGSIRGAVVHEVIAGFQKYYLAEGDRVLVDKEDAIITKISTNDRYIGKPYQPASPKLDRWGAMQLTKEELKKLEDENRNRNHTEDLKSIDHLLDLMSSDDSEGRKQEASHVITLKILSSTKVGEETYEEDEIEVTLNTAAELNDLVFSYALTVHKAQGAEWRKVYCILHHRHSQMISRELLYTAVTRAREELYIIYEPQRDKRGGTFAKGVETARLRGITWQEKAKQFKQELDEA